MIRALQTNDFKTYFRSSGALLIDDIQFCSGKDRSQEEFFHTFNNLLESQQQIVLTCDRYPKEMSGVEERLKSRLGWGLTVAIEPPDVETRVALLISKTEQNEISLPHKVAFFIAKRIHSNLNDKNLSLMGTDMEVELTGRIILENQENLRRPPHQLENEWIFIKDYLKVATEALDYHNEHLESVLSQKGLRSLIESTNFAMAQQDARSYLNGMQWELS
ncbi:chromosomal replication initiator protein DnaA [Trichonephila clavipes]|nr:chromosomal replication initiator protein DnaA [Trichonephila clavipes]